MREMFQCEVCGSVYADRAIADRCEKYELPPPPVEAGGQITVITRYSGDVPDKVLEWRIAPSSLADILTEGGAVKLLDSDEFYQWVAIVAGFHQIGREHWSSEILSCCIRELHTAE